MITPKDFVFQFLTPVETSNLGVSSLKFSFLFISIIPDNIGGCYGEPYRVIHSMSFIVTKDGNIENIQMEFGNVDMYSCPAHALDLMKIISSYGKLKPAERKGKPVNVKYIIEIKVEG